VHFEEMFHVGIRVPDLDAAMQNMTGAAAVSWSAVQHRQQQIWLPGSGVRVVDLRFTYSSEGPVHLEVLQGEPGSIWDADDAPGPHHLGFWVDDVARTTEELLGQGWTLELAGRAPEDGYGAFTYVRSPTGTIVEPVSTAVRPAFERWWAGGDL
jgi:catechol 2,3-dioxygenase-like lactoylglutathione lyase family enzyme